MPDTHINKKALRALVKKSSPGIKNRVNMRITLLPTTRMLMNDFVDVKNGGYGSTFIDLSLRLTMALLGDGESLPEIADELFKVSESPYFAGNLVSLRNYLVDKTKVEEISK